MGWKEFIEDSRKRGNFTKLDSNTLPRSYSIGTSEKQPPTTSTETVEKRPRAVCAGRYATIVNGRRVVRMYRAGEILQGRPLESGDWIP